SRPEVAGTFGRSLPHSQFAAVNAVALSEGSLPEGRLEEARAIALEGVRRSEQPEQGVTGTRRSGRCARQLAPGARGAHRACRAAPRGAGRVPGAPPRPHARTRDALTEGNAPTSARAPEHSTAVDQNANRNVSANIWAVVRYVPSTEG